MVKAKKRPTFIGLAESFKELAEKASSITLGMKETLVLIKVLKTK